MKNKIISDKIGDTLVSAVAIPTTLVMAVGVIVMIPIFKMSAFVFLFFAANFSEGLDKIMLDKGTK